MSTTSAHPSYAIHCASPSSLQSADTYDDIASIETPPNPPPAQDAALGAASLLLLDSFYGGGAAPGDADLSLDAALRGEAAMLEQAMRGGYKHRARRPSAATPLRLCENALVAANRAAFAKNTGRPAAEWAGSLFARRAPPAMAAAPPAREPAPAVAAPLPAAAVAPAPTAGSQTPAATEPEIAKPKPAGRPKPRVRLLTPVAPKRGAPCAPKRRSPSDQQQQPKPAKAIRTSGVRNDGRRLHINVGFWEVTSRGRRWVNAAEARSRKV